MKSPTIRTYVSQEIRVSPMASYNLLCTGGFFFQQTELSQNNGEDTSSMWSRLCSPKNTVDDEDKDEDEDKDKDVDLTFTFVVRPPTLPFVGAGSIYTGAVVSVLEKKTLKIHWVKVKDMTARGDSPLEHYVIADAKLAGNFYSIVFLLKQVLCVARRDSPQYREAQSWPPVTLVNVCKRQRI